MFEFGVGMDTKTKDSIRDIVVAKVATHLCLTLIIKEMRISVE